MNEQQAVHGQHMLAKMQQQMEEEAQNKQRMMINQLQIMSRMNMESGMAQDLITTIGQHGYKASDGSFSYSKC
jgi:tRNA G26 N,N-dimethylase Trm1